MVELASIRSRNKGMTMQDRYLFRGKRTGNGEWVQGNLVHSEDSEDGWETLIIPVVESNMYTDGGIRGNLGFENWFQVDKNTICQCTGLKDKNGDLIWENDIVNCIEEECCGRIVWNESEAGFYFDVLLEDGTYEEEHIYDYVDCMDVIGNVFDNPELLEVQE